MKRIFLFIVSVAALSLLAYISADAQTVTRSYVAPSSVSVDNVGNYGTTLPGVNFTSADFGNGCRVTDVDVSITWAKTDGTCTSPGNGLSYHNETSFRIQGPTLNQEVLIPPSYYGGGATMSSITTNFNQGSGAPTIAGSTPQGGTFGPAGGGNLNDYNGTSPFGTWNLQAGDNGSGDPLCITSYSVTVTTAPDNTDPTWTSTPSDITVNATSGQCSAPVSWPTPTATDLCGVSVTQTAGAASGSTFPVGTSNIAYRAEDPYGNFVNHSFTVEVVDNQAPNISCPADFTVIAPTGSCGANVNFTTPSASDNCSGTTVSQIAGPTSGSNVPVGSATITFRATDASSNTTDCSFVVSVVDIEDPSISCPADINVVSTTGSCGAVVNYTAPSASDNCSTGLVTALTNGLPSGSTFPSGTTTVEYIAIDASGNQDDCSFDVTVDPVPNGTVSLGPSPICQGDQTTLTFTFTSGTPPFNVQVTDGVNTFTVNGVSSGDTYVVTPPTTVTYSYVSIQDATGCVRTSDFVGTAQVVVTPLPAVSFSGLDAVYCETDAAVTLTGSQAGGTFTGIGVNSLGGGLGEFDPASAGDGGPYDVTYTFTDINNCTDSETQQTSVDEQPVADAGNGGDECDLDFDFSANPSVGTGTWTLVSGPGTPLYSNVNGPTSTVQVSQPGTYVFRWTEVNGECSDNDQISVNFYEVPSPDPGFGGTECDLNFTLNATPSVGVGTWTASGPGTATFAPDANDPNAVVTVDAEGTYTFTWTEDNNGCTNSADVIVTFDDQPAADAGSGGDECDLDFVFSAVPTVGNGTWTATGPGAATYSSANDPNATVTVSNYGTYVFTWTEINGNCSSVDQVTVNFYEQPVADAGNGGDQCDLDFTFGGSASAGSGEWTYTGSGTAAFVDDADPTTDVTVDTYGTYEFTWTETNGTCSDAETITVNFYEQPVADAGTGGDECNLDFTFSAVPSAGNGTWTVASGPGTASFADDTNATTDVTVSDYGTYVFTWTEVSGTCSDDASVTVNFYEQPVADAGNGGDACDLDFLLSATPSVGVGSWTQTSGSGTASFSNSSSPTALATVDQYGTYEFTWTETNGSCSDDETITVNYYDQPVADAGTGGQECDLDFDFTATLSTGIGEWTQTSGPGTSTFSDATDPAASVTVSQSGSYVFTWTETNGSCEDDASVTVEFFDQPVADAGAGADECDLNFTFGGIPSFGTGTWTYTGPGNAFFSNANSASATVTVDDYGTYEFTWTEVNGPCSDAATITVNFYEQPVANAGNGGSECDLDFDLNATASVGNGTWTYSGPGIATFAPSDTDPNATATVDATGSYVFTWTEDNNGCTDSDDVTVVFNPLPVVSFTGLAGPYCIDQTTPVPLTGSPAGGTFSGLGISGNSFVPSVAGVGTIFITYTYTDGNGCTDSETQSVDVNGLPNVSFTGLDAAYCEDDAAAYSLTGTPAGGAFSGAGITGDEFIPVDAGAGTHTITYTYTDPFGCTSFEDQQVVVNELPTVSFSGLASSYCENASNVQLTGSPTGGTFSGSGIIGNSFSPVSAGVGNHVITYTYTDANGCTNSESLSVAVNELPVPVISPGGVSEICDGENLVLDAGAGYAAYNWSTNQNGQTITVTQAGTYNVIVTSAEGCAGTSAPVQVVVNDSPEVDLGNDTTICTASVLNIDAGNPGATYAWSTQEISQSINVTTTGVFSVDVTDANGCTGSDNIAVTVANLLDPTIVAGGPLTFCAGDSVTLDAGAGYEDYLWGTGETDQVITVSTSGEVEVEVWDEFGCNGTDEVIVDVLQLPNAVISPSGTVEICEGDSVTLSATNNFGSYVWTPTSETTSSIEVMQSGTYQVTVEDPNNGCSNESNEVEVVVNTINTPSIVPSGPTQFCEGGSVSLSVEPGPYSSYLWCSGSTTPSIVVTQSGEYCVTVLDANGCVDSTLVGDPVVVEVWSPDPQVEQQGDSLVVTNGPFQQYQWYFNGSPIPGATGDFHIPMTSGNYQVEVWDDNDCSDESANIEFTVSGITDLRSVYGVQVMPNPTNGVVTLSASFGKPLDAALQVTDMMGRVVVAEHEMKGLLDLRTEIDLTRMTKGIYYLRLTTAEGAVVMPVVRN